MAVGFVLSACQSTDVELCRDEHPHRSDVNFTFDFSGNLEKPDTMTVFAIRNLNLLRYYMLVDVKADGKQPSTGNILAVTPEKFHEPAEIIEGTTNHRLTLHTGDYDLLAFSGNPEYYETNLEQVLRGTVDYVDSLRVFYHSYRNTNDHDSLKKFVKWESENTYSDFIIGGDKRPLYVAENTLTIPKKDSPTPIPCHFSAHNISQHITIEFDIDKTNNSSAIVDSIVCELSGIPCGIYLFSRIVDVSRTFKTLFKPRLDPKPASQSGANKVTVVGEVWVTGLMRSAASSYTTGPGILCFRAYIHTSSGKHHEIPAYINLFNVLSDPTTSSLIRMENGDIKQRSMELYIKLTPAILDLDKYQITSDEAIGIDAWWSPLGADTDIPVDI